MNLGMPEMIFIVLMALIIFGPRRLPEVARQVTRFMNDFRRASNEFKAQLESEVHKLEAEMEKEASAVKDRVGNLEPQILPPATPLPAGTIASGSSATEAVVSEPAAPLPETSSSTSLNPSQHADA
jgi:sec-independent protein translocase protein TatB